MRPLATREGGPIPFDDPSVDALPDETRAAIAEHWRLRTRSELRVGRAFAAMALRLAEQGASPLVVEGLARSAEEEERHADLCLRLAERHAGQAVGAPEIGNVRLPRFGVGDEELETALLVAGMCCVNETIATAWLGASLAVATTPLATAANRFHLGEEIGHARLGWAHLASGAVTPATRHALASCLPALLEANVPLWEREDALVSRDGLPAHGHLGAAASQEVVHEALRDLVIPGFAYVGVNTEAARTWLAQRAAR